MVSSSFFVASGRRAGLATLEIAVSRQIDVRPPVYTPAFVHDLAASAARHVVRRCRKFIGDFPRLRRLDGPRFTRRYYRRNLCERNSATLRFNLVNLWSLPLVRALWSTLEVENRCSGESDRGDTPATLQCHQRQKRGDPGNGRALREGVRRRRRNVAWDAGRRRPREGAPACRRDQSTTSRASGMMWLTLG